MGPEIYFPPREPPPPQELRPELRPHELDELELLPQLLLEELELLPQELLGLVELLAVDLLLPKPEAFLTLLVSRLAMAEDLN